MFEVALPQAQRIVAALTVIAALIEYLLIGFFPSPFIVALVLIALSLAPESRRRASAIITVALSILIPMAALLGYLREDLVIAVPIFDAIVFAWLFVCSLPIARGQAA